MRKAVTRVAFFVLLPLPLVAQNGAPARPTPKAELLGAYSFVHMEQLDMHGWNASVIGNVNKNLGIVGDVSGHYNRESSSGLLGTTRSELTFHSFMVGPQVIERQRKWFSPFAHALFGFTRVNASVTASGASAAARSVSNDVSGFSMVLGGGLDLTADDRFSYRLIQADYYLIRSDRFKHEGLRLSAGVLFRFGKRED